MGIVFGVYRNWIWEFGDLKSDTPILWGSIWPDTIISNPIFFFPRLHRIWDPNTSSHQGGEGCPRTQQFEHLHNTSVDLMASDYHDERLWGALAVVALVVFLTYEKRRRARTLAE